ncbi:hypothetical protein DFA_02528 [Cavenderia fasciculata]|uniref:Transglutaminase-like domain-containing protein n=1 Tax=Cavenderia fasciculata TaxID=261658 RepID=F4PZM5_CACFS|nr:uncharacterized protein DFA_02528 [Cavenderia fasciculata]EGG18789.1 hypothetical protein DFA_02528 [Cavenderia fasciculata]|eukprot:XP_004357251.1 hypothetical protein DFA_02528 [Cavenderia fasciculata]
MTNKHKQLAPLGRPTGHRELDIVSTFMLHCCHANFEEATKLTNVNMNKDQIQSFFNQSLNFGPFQGIKDATVIGNGHIYLTVLHNTDLQWVFWVNKQQGRIGGWDFRKPGNFRKPTENGQRIIDILESSTQHLQQQSLEIKSLPLNHHFNVSKVLRLQWSTPITNDRDLMSDGNLELILPPDRPFQRHGSFYVLSPQQGVTILGKYNRNCNTYIALQLPRPLPSSITYALDIFFSPQPITSNHYNDQWELSKDDPSQYLGITTHTSAKIDPFHPKIIEIRNEILRGKENYTILEKAKVIARWVGDIPYEMIKPGMQWPTLEQYLSSGFRYVECGGHALFFVMLCRSAGIPARRLFHPCLDAHTKKFGSHCIAEFYDSTHGWIPVDATEKFDEHNSGQWLRIPMSTPGLLPTGFALTVESMDGHEKHAINAKHNNTLQDCHIECLADYCPNININQNNNQNNNNSGPPSS